MALPATSQACRQAHNLIKKPELQETVKRDLLQIHELSSFEGTKQVTRDLLQIHELSSFEGALSVRFQLNV